MKQRDDLPTSLAAGLDENTIVICTVGGCVASWHPAIARQFGYEAGEFVGQGIDALLTPAGVSEEFPAALAQGQYRRKRTFRRKDGKPVPVEVITVPLSDGSGSLASFALLIRVLSGGTTNVAALAEALDNSNILIRDFTGVVEHWTKGCERLYGWSAEEARGQKLQELLHTTFPKPAEEIERDLLAHGKWQGELLRHHKDGRQMLISSDWVLVRDDSGGVPRVICTDIDITSRLAMQRELEASNERFQKVAVELERSNQELEEFARIASHDLSAPITTARWLTDLLMARHSGKLDEEGITCVRQISSSLERMSDLIEAILAHALAGKQAISSLTETDADAALDAAMENLQRDIATSGAVVERTRLPKLLIQSQALTQLFQNLLSNAIKYRRPGVAPRIEISAARQGESWTVEVRDNGIGIEKEWFERIFLPLQRRHGSNVKGSGIGLATCRKIVNRAGGDIWVESEVDKGSAFYFSLPAAVEIAR